MLELITKSQGKSFSKSNEEILYIWKPQIETSASMLHVYAAMGILVWVNELYS